MSAIQAITFKHPAAGGLRCFSSAEAALNAGENPASLHAVGGVLVKWPGALGTPPDGATVAAWEAEYQAEVIDRETVDANEHAQAKANAQVIAMMNRTPAQIDTFVDNQVTSIAGVQTALKLMLRMIVVLLRRSFR